MLKSKKNVFWEALVITIAIFVIGLFLGILVENSNSNKISDLYIKSEIDLVDGTTMLRLSEDSEISCDIIKKENINFANKIYEEAKILEKYEDSGKLTEGMKLLHKKYDLLRTLIWLSNQKSLERCNNYNLMVYLYDYKPEDSNKKAIQNIWSKVLLDVKNKNKDLLLLPIATNQNLTSLNILLEEYNIDSKPAIIINNDKVIYSLENIEKIESLLN
jgi:hypothetical protein|tara:strand:+ start:693 stop:1343 length:651 start_codon:yes stop_codon:yes gene_type:complete